MNDRIFYSWQSDLPNATNRGFIQGALEQAAKSIRSDGTLAVEPVVDRDTQGAPGSPDISATIFEKIDTSSVFVADVSNIAPAGNSGGLLSLFRSKRARPVPNPNVLVELGYAVGKLGWSRIVLVLNTAFGPVEQLPFDLRQRRVCCYRSSPGDTERAPERKRLAGVLRGTLVEVLSVPAVHQQDSEDIVAQVAHAAELIPKPQSIEHPIYRWDVMAREPDDTNRDGWRRAARHCTVRVFSEDLLVNGAFQPANENAFKTDVASFFSGEYPELDDPSPRGVRLYNRSPDLSFDREWTWGTAGRVGVVGFAATLPTVNAPTIYSVADVASDIARFLRLASKMLRNSPASVWLELSAPDLPFVWSGAATIRASRTQTFAPESKPGGTAEAIVVKQLDAGEMLAGREREVTSELVQIALTHVHRVRVERDAVAALLQREEA